MSYSESDAKKAAVIMLLEAYEVVPSVPRLKAWSVGMQDLSAEQVQAAVTSVLQSDKPFRPRPGELRAIALGGQRTLEQEAELAWVELSAALDKGTSKGMDDRTRHVMEGLGGFNHLFHLSRKDIDFKRNQFIKLFQAMVKQASAPQLTNQQPERPRLEQSLTDILGVKPIVKGVEQHGS